MEGFTSGLGGMLGGLFGHSDRPFDKAMEQYNNYGGKSIGTQEPYNDAGKGAISDYQTWLEGKKDPSKFVNDQMKNYKESDWAHNLQQQSVNAGQNAASASGLMGSTPMMQQLQQNSNNISSEDQNKYLQNVLGVDKTYGEGQNNLVNVGQNASKTMSDTYNSLGKNMGEAAYGKEAGKQQDFWNAIGGAGKMIGSFF